MASFGLGKPGMPILKPGASALRRCPFPLCLRQGLLLNRRRVQYSASSPASPHDARARPAHALAPCRVSSRVSTRSFARSGPRFDLPDLSNNFKIGVGVLCDEELCLGRQVEKVQPL
jgi:hypothetical protein